MRSVIIPSTYNPYNLYYWVQNFKNKWYKSVDRVYLYLEGDLWKYTYYENPLFHSNFNLLKDLCLDICQDPKIKIITDDTPNLRVFSKENIPSEPRSKAFLKLISCCEGDTIFISHDDFILQSGEYIEEWFSDVESGNIDYIYFIGTNSKILYNEMSKIYDVSFLKKNVPDWVKAKEYFPFGMTSYGFVSNLKLLIESNGEFGDRPCKKGDFVKELNWTSTIDFVIDYFHLTPLKWHSLGYKNVKSFGDGYTADFKNRQRAPYAYLTVKDFCEYDYPYFHVCLGSFFIGNVLVSLEKLKKELEITYSSNPNSAEIIERFLYFNVGYIDVFPETLISNHKLESFHKNIKEYCKKTYDITYNYYKNLGWRFNKNEYFGIDSLKRYI